MTRKTKSLRPKTTRQVINALKRILKEEHEFGTIIEIQKRYEKERCWRIRVWEGKQGTLQQVPVFRKEERSQIVGTFLVSVQRLEEE